MGSQYFEIECGDEITLKHVEECKAEHVLSEYDYKMMECVVYGVTHMHSSTRQNAVLTVLGDSKFVFKCSEPDGHNEYVIAFDVMKDAYVWQRIAQDWAPWFRELIGDLAESGAKALVRLKDLHLEFANPYGEPYKLDYEKHEKGDVEINLQAGIVKMKAGFKDTEV